MEALKASRVVIASEARQSRFLPLVHGKRSNTKARTIGNLRCAHVLRVPLAIERNEALNPADVSQLGMNTEMLHPDTIAGLVWQFGLLLA